MAREENTIQVEKVDGEFNPNRVRALIYGESGIGKTRFASTWPHALFVDIDDGMASVDAPCHRAPIKEWAEIFDVYEWIANGEHPFKTIVIDSLNEAQALGLQNTVTAFPKIRRAYETLASQSDYGKMLSDFDLMIRYYKALPYNLLLIAQVEAKEFDTDIVQPQLIGKNTSRNICRMMDVVGYMFRSGEAVTMGFALSEYVSKDRSGKLPTTLDNPSYAKLLRYWKGGGRSKSRE